jgi:hypothetical protein
MAAPEDQIRSSACALIRRCWPAARILNEVGLAHGQARADVIALSPTEAHGFELKSHADSLRRLPAQVRAYGETIDRATLLVSERLYMAALPMLPPWWGVCRYRLDGILEVKRAALPNPAPAPLTTARLLWRDEALALLKKLGHARGLSKADRLRLYRELVSRLEPAELRGHVRQALLSRPDWKP